MSAAIAINCELRERIPLALRATNAPAKVLSFQAGVSKRTIAGLQNREHVISASALLALARQYPHVKALVLELIGETTDRAPDRILEEIRKLVSK
jgi:hypothetical protein